MRAGAKMRQPADKTYDLLKHGAERNSCRAVWAFRRGLHVGCHSRNPAIKRK
ncbi:MAG: hypothetical protein RL386_2018 [Bacteroidota bacterium]